MKTSIEGVETCHFSSIILIEINLGDESIFFKKELKEIVEYCLDIALENDYFEMNRDIFDKTFKNMNENEILNQYNFSNAIIDYKKGDNKVMIVIPLKKHNIKKYNVQNTQFRKTLYSKILNEYYKSEKI